MDNQASCQPATTCRDTHSHQGILGSEGLGVAGRGWPWSPLNVPTPGPVSMTTRRRRGEDGISLDQLFTETQSPPQPDQDPHNQAADPR